MSNAFNASVVLKLGSIGTFCHTNTSHFHNILRPFDVLPNFPFTTSETMRKVTYKHGIYEFPQELPSNLRLRISGN